VAWTIDELATECGRVLIDEPQPSGRVNDVPDLRTIRYYAALGLLDAPCGFEKKKALYDERHLLQLLAIKRLQRAGLALAEIQKQLAGLSDARLKTVAQLPETPPVPRPRERFWAAKPRAVPAVQAFRITRGITVLVDDAPRTFTDDDARALRAWLEQRGLAAEEQT
jgi:DNA-binding transcriptional MerR regulator